MYSSLCFFADLAVSRLRGAGIEELGLLRGPVIQNGNKDECIHKSVTTGTSKLE